MSGEILCLTETISQNCIGTTVEVSEAGAKAFVSEITSTALTLMKAAIYFGGRDLSRNMIRGIASLRCVLTSGFDNSWTLLLAVYYAAAEFGQENKFIAVLNDAYPYICTCTEDSATIQSWMGMDSSNREQSDKMKALDYCSEEAETQGEKTKYRARMTREFEKTDKDWGQMATMIMEEADANYDGKITAEEFADALLFEFDVQATADEYDWIIQSLKDACGEFDASGDGLDLAELQTCGEARGNGIWGGAKEWAADKRNGYDQTVWVTILSGADTNSDGQWSAAEGVAAIASYFNVSGKLSTNLTTKLESQLTQICGNYDTDSSGGLNETEMVQCLRDNGQHIYMESKYIAAALANKTS